MTDDSTLCPRFCASCNSRLSHANCPHGSINLMLLSHDNAPMLPIDVLSSPLLLSLADARSNGDHIIVFSAMTRKVGVT
jgi:hypothetical protein